MSDNNADFNGTGQVNNPTSDNAAQADYNQPYIPQQNDAQMNHPESQPETPAYDQNSAAYTQPAQPAEPVPFRRTIRTLPHTAQYGPGRSAVIRSAGDFRPGIRYGSRLYPAGSAGHAAAPVYDPNAASYNQYGQYGQPSQLPNLRSRRTVSRQPRRMTPTTLTPSRITTKRTTDSRATRPRLTTNPPTPSLPTRSSRHTASPSHRPDTPEVETGSRSAWHLPGLLRRAQLLLGQHRQGRGTAAADRHRLDSHHRPSRRRHLGTGGRHPDSVLSLRLAMAP